MNEVCDGNEQCIYDVSMTRDVSVGKYSMEAIQAQELAEKYTVKGGYPRIYYVYRCIDDKRR